MGGYGIGFTFGPTAGGILFDTWGFAAPFLASAGVGVVALLFALAWLPETCAAGQGAVDMHGKLKHDHLLVGLPRPLYLFGALLALDFVANFGFAFIQPQLIFYVYNQLSFSTTQLGLLFGVYGVTQIVGQFTLARLSDRFGRRPPIVLGFALNIGFFLGLRYFGQFVLLVFVTTMAGIGNALVLPALSAFYLDITDAAHRSRVMGVKGSIAALGEIAGPLAVALSSPWFGPREVFLSAAVLVGLAALFALTVLRAPQHSVVVRYNA